MFKTIAAATLMLGLATGAFAQYSSSGNDSSGMATGDKSGNQMQMWKGAIGNAFFSDMTTGKLRSKAEVHKRWAKLTTAQKTKVRNDCKTMGTGNPTGPMAEACSMVKTM